MIEISSAPPRKSSATFENLRQSSENAREMWSWTLEDKIHIHAQACNILYVLHAHRSSTIYSTFSSPVLLVLKCRYRASSSGRPKKFEFFHWLPKNECAVEIKITKLCAFHFTSGPVDSSPTGFAKNAKQLYSWSIRRNRRSLHVTKEVGRLQRRHSRS